MTEAEALERLRAITTRMREATARSRAPVPPPRPTPQPPPDVVPPAPWQDQEREP